MLKRALDRWVSSRLKKFIGRHAGETCYIFGGGSSLKWFDLRHFADHVGIAVNLFPFHKDFNRLRVKYVTITQPWLFAPPYCRPPDETRRKFEPVVRIYRRQVIEHYRGTTFFVHPTGYPFLAGDNVECLFRTIPIGAGMSPRINQFNLGAGAFNASLALAYLLGFTRAYLIGFDAWVFDPANDRRWFEYGLGQPRPLGDESQTFLNILKQRMDLVAVGVKMQSTNFAYVEYEKLVGEKPVYRENHELLESAIFRVLLSHPTYTMTGPA